MTSRIPQKVLITGAGGALGSHVVRRFAEAGTQVLAVDLRKGEPRPGVTWVEMNLADPTSVRAALAGHTDVDGLVHCAGGFRWAKLDQVTDADIEFLLSANLKSALVLTRQLLPAMLAADFGRIVYVSAKATLAPGAGMGAYAASKAGLNMLVSALADEVRANDINVNAVLPTMIDTPANRKDMPTADFNAWVRPEELADILFSLTQPWGRPIHGALIPVAGRL